MRAIITAGNSRHAVVPLYQSAPTEDERAVRALMVELPTVFGHRLRHPLNLRLIERLECKMAGVDPGRRRVDQLGGPVVGHSHPAVPQNTFPGWSSLPPQCGIPPGSVTRMWFLHAGARFGFRMPFGHSMRPANTPKAPGRSSASTASISPRCSLST